MLCVLLLSAGPPQSQTHDNQTTHGDLCVYGAKAWIPISICTLTSLFLNLFAVVQQLQGGQVCAGQHSCIQKRWLLCDVHWRCLIQQRHTGHLQKQEQEGLQVAHTQPCVHPQLWWCGVCRCSVDGVGVRGGM